MFEKNKNSLAEGDSLLFYPQIISETHDFYPFVRAELKEHDPDMHHAMEVLWGANTQERIEQERSLVAFMDARPAPAGWAKADSKTALATAQPAHSKSCEPRSAYKTMQIEGWTIHVAPSLKDRKAYVDEICKLLEYKLHMVKLYVPEKALPMLQKVPIWLEYNDEAVRYMVYHDSKSKLTKEGLNPEKYGSIEIGNTENFRNWHQLQPSMLLYQLAFAYFDRLSDADRQKVKASYEKALKGGKLDNVLRFDGARVRHPALLGDRDFFAEMSESYYGFNDHYPFLQFELAQLDDDICKLLARVWGGKAK